MKLWLDDVRPPWQHGCLGWDWARTYDEAIAMLATGRATEADLDHDLTEKATLGDWTVEKTGYEVVCWMRDYEVWPPDGVRIHSVNREGRARMQEVVDRHYRRNSCAWVPAEDL